MRLVSGGRKDFRGPHDGQSPRLAEITRGEDGGRARSKGRVWGLDTRSSGSNRTGTGGREGAASVEGGDQHSEVLEAGESVPGAVWGPFR